MLLAVDMVVAILSVHLPNGFFTNNNGYEFPLVLLAASIGLAVAGAGEAALDKVIVTRVSNPKLVRLMR